MQYEYVIYHEPEMCSEIITEEVLPNIQVGNVLLAETYRQSLKIGESPVIRRIETYLYAPIEKAAPTHVRISVYLF